MRIASIKSKLKQIYMESRSFFSAARKSVMAIAIAVITIPVIAGTSLQVDPVEDEVTVRYLGTDEQSLIFNVKYANADASKFFVTIRDADGTTLYQNSFTDISFNKRFSLPKTESNKLVFIISDKQSNYNETFEITTKTRVVEDVLVNRIR
jgi:hypothetical protein